MSLLEETVEKPLDLDALPGTTLIPRKKAAKYLNVSVDTVDNMFTWGLLEKVRTSPRRVCTTVRSLRKRLTVAAPEAA
jgi:hypothetical protein